MPGLSEVNNKLKINSKPNRFDPKIPEKNETGRTQRLVKGVDSFENAFNKKQSIVEQISSDESEKAEEVLEGEAQRDIQFFLQQ